MLALMPAQLRVTERRASGFCLSFADTSTAAVEKVNSFVAAFNAGTGADPYAGPAIDALNASADVVEAGHRDDVFATYSDAARQVANAIGTHASTAEFNDRVDRFNRITTKARELCVG